MTITFFILFIAMFICLYGRARSKGNQQEGDGETQNTEQRHRTRRRWHDEWERRYGLNSSDPMVDLTNPANPDYNAFTDQDPLIK